MADTIASLVAVISADVSGAVNGFNKVGSGLSGISDQMLKTGAALTAGVTLPIIGFMGAAVKAASDLQTQLAQTNAVIKSTGGVAGVTADAVLKLANDMSNSTRYSKDQVISAENLLLTFRDIGKNIFPDVTKATLDMSQALGQDTKSSAIQLGKALEDPVRGIGALRRVGVAFTDEQKNMIDKLVKTGDLLGAQRIILREIQTEFGGSAKAAGQTFAGQIDILNHKFTDFQEKVGNILIPFLTKLLDKGTQVVNWLNTLNPGILQAGLVFAGLVAAIGPLVTILGAIGAAVAFLATPLGAIVVAVGAIGLAWSTNFLGMRDRVNELGTTLRNAWTTLTQLGTILELIVVKGLHDASVAAKQLIDILTILATKLAASALGVTNVGTTQASDGSGFGGIGSGANITGGGVSGTVTQHAGGGFVGSPTLSTLGENGSEYVVPHNGALVASGGGYRGPSTLHVVLQADQFEQHLYLNIADAMRAGVH